MAWWAYIYIVLQLLICDRDLKLRLCWRLCRRNQCGKCLCVVLFTSFFVCALCHQRSNHGAKELESTILQFYGNLKLQGSFTVLVPNQKTSNFNNRHRQPSTKLSRGSCMIVLLSNLKYSIADLIREEICTHVHSEVYAVQTCSLGARSKIMQQTHQNRRNCNGSRSQKSSWIKQQTSCNTCQSRSRTLTKTGMRHENGNEMESEAPLLR